MNIKQPRDRRRARVRAKVQGTKSRPRLSVFRSNAHMFAQLIDDEKGLTLASAGTKGLVAKGTKDKTKSEKAFMIGELLAQKAADIKIKTIVFDRGGYQYHGRVKQVAEGARKGGLEF